VTSKSQQGASACVSKHMTYKLDNFWKLFEIALKMKRHILRCNIYEGAPVVIYQTSSLTLLSEIDRKAFNRFDAGR
jgi:hypothetical protein